jgi:hypothetical protein
MPRRSKNVVIALSAQATLKRRLRRHLTELGFTKGDSGSLKPPGTGKDAVRMLHAAQRNERLEANRHFLTERSSELIKHFASGSDVEPGRISPVLQQIAGGTWESDLFRLASLTWSVPVSAGFGRRMRYLVWDNHNGKLIGIIAIGDPVFNLSARDNLVKWDASARGERLVNIMDAYVLGALPPYNALLGGKLVACLLRSRDVYDEFSKAYGKTTGIISGNEKKARLLAITTSSSMGRSSLYNRLRLAGHEYFRPIGYTGGWGHFHIPDKLFADLREYLRLLGHSYADHNRFGQGPNWRLRTTRAALVSLGFDGDTLQHGIQRQVFWCELAKNAAKVLRTGKGRPDLSTLLSAEDVAALAVERWVIPRAERMPEFRQWKGESILSLLGAQPLKVVAKRTSEGAGWG